MKAVILVGGEGTRLRPLTYDLPKPMVPICGKPFMEYQLHLMKEHGINEVIFSLGYKWKVFEDHFADGADIGMKLHYVVEDSPLGTAGAIKNVEDYLDEDTFCVFNGDILSDFNLQEIFKIHARMNAKCTIALTPVEDPTLYGLVELDGQGKILRFTEKPKREDVRSNLINAGFYVLDRSILNKMIRGKNYSIEREIFPEALKRGEMLVGYSHSGYWLDIGSPLKYITANYDVLQSRLKSPASPTAQRHVAPDAIIGENVSITEPVWIGNGVKIEDGSRIIGPTVIGDYCTVGESSLIERSVLWPGSSIGNNCSLEEVIVGRYCSIGDKTALGGLSVIGSYNVIVSTKSPEE